VVGMSSNRNMSRGNVIVIVREEEEEEIKIYISLRKEPVNM
jgi:hypothetical protein